MCASEGNQSGSAKYKPTKANRSKKGKKKSTCVLLVDVCRVVTVAIVCEMSLKALGYSMGNPENNLKSS